jgi:DNA-binding transcriptional LysR family regulator
MFDWQDLRYFLVLARMGSLSAASSELSVEHATVGRRVASLEAALGLRLIRRLPRSSPLTEDGKAFAALATAMEEAAETVQGYARRSLAAVSAVVRVSVPPTIGNSCIAPRIGAFRALHPEVKIVLHGFVTNAALDRGDADIAVRMIRPQEGSLLARRIGVLRFGLYSTREYVARAAAEWEFIAYEQSLGHVRHEMWLRKLLAGRPVVFEASDVRGQQLAARAGVGVALLPTMIGDNDPSLIRLELEAEPPKSDLWLVTYQDARRVPAIRAVMEFLVECIEREPRLRK